MFRDSENADRIARRAVAFVILFFLIDGVLRTAYFHLGARATGSSRPFLDSLLSELTGSTATLFVFFLILLPACRRWPLRGPTWPRHLGFHVVALLLYSITKTLLMWGLRLPLWPLFGLGNYDYGQLSFRFPMEFANDVLSYAILAAAVHAWSLWRSAQNRVLREARLEARLQEARLQALQGQLQPHFLFNTLNVISSVMYSDAEQADRLISRLSDLLRSSLASPGRSEVTIEEELHLLSEYVEIMRARFGDRLVVTTRLAPTARAALVPVFLLQPLVENAIHHGVARRADAGSIDITVSRERDTLTIQVVDDGPGVPGDTESLIGQGVGLRNTRERLHHLHGESASLELANGATRGAVTTVRMPFRRAPEPTAADSIPEPLAHV